MKTTKPMEGTWTLVAPNGNRYHGATPLKCCKGEQEERIPTEVALKRLFDFINSEDEEYIEAKRLAVWMWDHWYKDDSPEWEPFSDLMGVLSQIDNMLTGLRR